MVKKDLDLKGITAQSLNKAYAQHGLSNKQNISEQQSAIKPEFNILDYVPSLKISTKSLEQLQPKNLNEQIIRNIFSKLIVQNDFKKTIKNLDDILNGKGETADFSLKFNALAVLNTFSELTRNNPQVSGWLMEVMMAGLVNGYKVGQEGKTADIVQRNGDEVSIKAPTVQADGRIQFKQGLKNITDSIIAKGSIPYYFALLTEDENGTKIEFTEMLFNKESFSIDGFFSKGLSDNREDLKKNHWADLFSIYYSDNIEKAKLVIDKFFKDPSVNTADKFFDYIQKPLNEQITNSSNKNLLNEAAYVKSLSLEKFRRAAGKPIAILFVSPDNILKQYSNMLQSLRADFEEMLAPAHYSMFYLNDFLLNKNYSSILQSRDNSQAFVAEVNKKQEKLKSMSDAATVAENLDLTDEAKDVMMLLEKMEG